MVVTASWHMHLDFCIRIIKALTEVKRMKVQWKALLISLAASLGTGILSALFTPTVREQYEVIYQPPLAPPGWVFPVVWTVLYLLMGLAAFVVYVSDAPKEERNAALKLYGIQLFFHFVWPVAFFRFHAYSFAFLWLIALWILVFFTVNKFHEIDELAGKLMIPDLLWLTFAAYLNLSIALYYI